MSSIKSIEDINDIWFYYPSISMYINYSTGERQKAKPDSPHICNLPPKSNYGDVYIACFVSVGKDIHQCVGHISLNAPIKGDKKRLLEARWTKIIHPDKSMECVDFHWWHGWYPNISDRGFVANTDEDLKSIMRNTFGSCFAMEGGNNFINLSSVYVFESFLRYKECSRKESPKQKLIDELVKLTPPIEDVQIPEFSTEADSYGEKFCTISKIEGYSEPCVVLRAFIVDPADKTNILEGNRIYILKKKTIAAKKTNNVGYVTSTAQHPSYWKHNMLPIDKDIAKGTMLEYFCSIVNEVDMSQRTQLLFLCLKEPLIEQLFKNGYSDIVKSIVNQLASYGEKYNNILENYFGEINPKGKTLYKKLGVSKSVLEHLNNICASGDIRFKNRSRSWYWYGSLMSPVAAIKEMEGNANIDYLDNNSLDYYFNLLENSDSNNKQAVLEIVRMYKDLYGNESFKNKREQLYGMLINDEGWRSTYTRESPYSPSRFITTTTLASSLLKDYLHMVTQMNDAQHFKVNFKTMEELQNAHDMITEIFNLKKDEILYAKFADAVKKLNKYAYEKGDFAVVVPKTANELAHEGITLHHCVKSYIGRVANETTGIVFIREKSNLEEPFYTVEVQNDTVMQIHGACNCNVTDENLMGFVQSWIKSKNLKTNPHGFNIVR